MSTLTVIARIRAKPDASDRLREALLNLLGPTRAEAGCIAFELHRDLEDPLQFILIEQWASRDALEAHWGSPHLLAYRRATQELIEVREIRFLDRIA